MTTPSSIRFDADVVERLSSYVNRHPGQSRSSAAARFVDEGLRMDEHPGIYFRNGPAGRRAALVGGPDVWEVVRSVRSLRTSEPDLDESELHDLLEDATGVSRCLQRLAIAYWSRHPEEIDALLLHADRVETEAERAAELLAP